jgi:chemotaxis protein methyltransferase CheR
MAPSNTPIRASNHSKLPLLEPQPFDRDLEFNQADFERVRRLIHERVGIDLHPSKQNMVYSRLSRRLRERGHRTFRSYLDGVQSGTDTDWQEFVNSLTTNLTSFYREAHHFDVLAERLRNIRSGEVARIWCCAASTGEEPYSIAMTATEARVGSASAVVHASDVDTEVLATAERGIYSLESVAALSEARLRRFFLKGSGANAGRVRVKPELRSMVTFRPFNLLTNNWRMEPYDIVFCRNVMIYFDRPTQRRVLEGLHACLKPGGLLMVGHSENFSDHRDLFKLSGKTVYLRSGA